MSNICVLFIALVLSDIYPWVLNKIDMFGKGKGGPLNLLERSYKESDRLWLWNLYESSLRQFIEEEWGWDEEMQEEVFFGKLPFSKFKLVSSEGSLIAAYLIMEESDHHYVKMLLVNQGFRRRGVGKHLMQNICKQAQNVGVPVRLSVINCNPAISFYENLGFNVTSKSGGSTYMSFGEHGAST